MCGQLDAKIPLRQVRVRRATVDETAIESGWQLVRFEPESGNAVCERNEARMICPRDEFESLNFPGSDEVWSLIHEADDRDLQKACVAWAKLDLRGTALALLQYTRKLDPAFHDVQLLSDLDKKILKVDDICRKTLDLLRVETKRKRDEYERQTASNASEIDKKDELLLDLRNLEDRSAAQDYRHDVQLPAWRRLASAIRTLNAAAEQ